jgi:hypothetical protein
MEFILGLFLGLTFWQYVLILFFIVGGIFSHSLESGLGLISVFVFFIIGFGYTTNGGLFSIIVDNPFLILFSVLAYFAIGGLYTLFYSWPKWLNNRKKDINSSFANFKKVNKEKSEDEFYNSTHYKKYTASENLDTIGFYISNWVFDAIWRVISEPVRILWENTYRFFAKAFEKITRKTVDNILKDTK